eukprot:TRINITY_DN31092_c0_g1_i2.p1 TRINITY_DN31092_c0_g1~~TRINITY_DN31092_c0_g1_i2.p1  ORF type:complete len:122 (-),score=19.87 TRINITY_DN31092_c0_g1_i2:32-397(-)
MNSSYNVINKCLSVTNFIRNQIDRRLRLIVHHWLIVAIIIIPSVIVLILCIGCSKHCRHQPAQRPKRDQLQRDHGMQDHHHRQKHLLIHLATCGLVLLLFCLPQRSETDSGVKIANVFDNQ